MDSERIEILKEEIEILKAIKDGDIKLGEPLNYKSEPSNTFEVKENVKANVINLIISDKRQEIESIKNNGKVKFLVALQCGGLMESPEIYYTDHQTIIANSEKEATDIYNEKNNCSYFYGKCLGRI